MRDPAYRTGVGGAAVLDDTTASVPQDSHHTLTDTYAWSSGMFLSDGRFATIAWLKSYPAAISAPWRRYR